MATGVAGDRVFGAVLPPQANGAVVEFYVEAVDADNLTNTWPAAAQLADGSYAQAANALYQVDDNLDPVSPANTGQPF